MSSPSRGKAGAGSDVAGITTKAVRDGNGWRLNGTKVFITNGATADVLFVGAKTDTNVKGSRGISIFIVPRDTPGFSVARTLDKTGWRSSDTAELVFEDAYLPGDALLGEENRGFYAIMDNFQNERLTLGAMAVGMAMAGIELTLDWVKQRQAFGKTLWDIGAIRQRLSMAASEVEASRQLLWHAAWLDSQGQDCVREVPLKPPPAGEQSPQDPVYDKVRQLVRGRNPIEHAGSGNIGPGTREKKDRRPKDGGPPCEDRAGQRSLEVWAGSMRWPPTVDTDRGGWKCISRK